MRSGNAELRAEVESLLRSHEEAGTFIEEPVAAAPKLAPPLPDSLSVGADVGPYRIVQLIAEGGMGSVYQAVRVDDLYRKVVAIKVIRRGVYRRIRAQALRHRTPDPGPPGSPQYRQAAGRRHDPRRPPLLRDGLHRRHADR